MSSDVGRVFAGYTRRSVIDNEIDSSGDPFVEIRQTRGPLIGVDSTNGHQTSTINDCMYRNIGSFRYIAVMDFDELIVPRQNFSTLPKLIDHLTSSSNRTVSSFIFLNAQFFEQLATNAYYANYTSIVRPSLLRNNTFSVYLSQQHRAAASPRWFVIKSIIDADACVGMWVHRYRLFTEHIRNKIGHDFVEMFEVDDDKALKHHYRTSCNLDSFRTFYSPGSCEREKRSPVMDGVMSKYGIKLMTRLSDRYETFDL